MSESESGDGLAAVRIDAPVGAGTLVSVRCARWARVACFWVSGDSTSSNRRVAAFGFRFLPLLCFFASLLLCFFALML
ncbi:hypothetical protein [Burkholderia mayonis]|uniref:hypothetical protein n=1 Tax=Burkholderia mayonis TaxID=1385591 RepID=UPI00131F0A99|nr:hypothetical protein [Burkholderia mayonis]